MSTSDARAALLRTLAVTAALALAGCASLPKPSFEIHHQTITLTPERAGKEVALALDQELEVRLPSDPTTGFAWQRDAADTGVLAVIGKPGFERERLDTNVFENAGFDVWHFKPTAAGQQTLRFEYRRPGQLMTEPPEAVWYLVTVR